MRAVLQTHRESGFEMDETDKLLERLKAGEKTAAGELLERERNYLRRFIELRLDSDLRSRVDPSDVVQETLMAVGERIDEFVKNRPMSFRLWVRRKAEDKLVELRRKHLARKRSVGREIHLTDASSMLIARGWLHQSPSHIAQQEEQSKRVRQAIQSLDEKDREVLLLRHVEQLANTEVAELLEITTDAASKRYGRAVKRLAIFLRTDEE